MPKKKKTKKLKILKKKKIGKIKIKQAIKTSDKKTVSLGVDEKPEIKKIKKDIIEHLWKVIISDNTVDQYESNLMRRICGLIYFPDKECAEIKLKLINSK